MPRRLKEIPDVSEDFLKYQELNPAYSTTTTDSRAWEDINQAFFKKDSTEPHGHNEIIRRLKLFQIAMREKIQQLSFNPTWMKKGGSNTEEFKAAPRTFLKTIQEVLTHPTERMVFKRSEDVFDGMAFRDALGTIIVDPRYISDTLLRNLGLEEFIPEKGTRQEGKLEKRAEAIPEIRTILQSLEPISLPGERHQSNELNYFRLMRIAEGKNRGHILGTQNTDKGKKILFKTDLYGAGRRISHIEQGHAEETRKLKWIEMTLGEIYRNLKNWNNVTPEELKEMQDAILEIIKSLQYVDDYDKKEILRKIKQCLDLKDVKGKFKGKRYNPGAKRTIISSSLRYFGGRYKTMEKEWRHLSRDKMRLYQLVDGQEAPLRQFCQKVSELHDKFLILQTENTLSNADKKRIIRNLKARKENAKNLTLEPHLSFGEKFSAQIDKVIEALESDKPQEAAQEFVKIYLITKIAQAHGDLQRTYKKISLQADVVHPIMLQEEIQTIHDNLASHDVAPNIVAKEYGSAYGEIYRLLNSLKKHLRGLVNPAEFESATPRRAGAADEDEGVQLTLDGILEGVAQRAPRLGRFFAKVNQKVNQVIKAPKRKRSAKKPSLKRYTEKQKLLTFERMKKRIKEFDFAELVTSLG